MEEIMISEYARQLRDAHGDRAIAEAAQRAAECERNKDKDEAKTWRRVEQALKTIQGPIASSTQCCGAAIAIRSERLGQVGLPENAFEKRSPA